MAVQTKKYLISIITVNFNNIAGLSNTFNSVKSQDFEDFEWLVIDGGSTDGSADFIERNASEFSYYISEKDNGIYDAMNKGIRHSNGAFLLFLNSGDILIDKNTLQDVSQFLKEEVIYSGDCRIKDISGESWVKQSRQGLDIFDLYYYTLPHQSTFIHSGLFTKYGLYREDFRVAGDHESWVRFMLMGCDFKSIPILVSEMEAGGIGTIISEDSVREKKWIHEKYFKNFGYGDIHFLLWLKNHKWIYSIYKTIKNVLK